MKKKAQLPALFRIAADCTISAGLFIYADQYAGSAKDAGLVCLAAFSFNLENAAGNFFSVVVWFMPVAWLLYRMGNRMQEQIADTGAFVFTRTQKRSAWFLRNAGGLLCGAGLYCGLYTAVILGLCAFKGYPIGADDAGLALQQFILSVLHLYCLLILVNGLDAVSKVQNAYLIGVLATLSAAFASSIAAAFMPEPEMLLNLLPTVHAILLAHKEFGISFAASAAYFTVLACVLTGLFTSKAKMMDIY